MPRDPDQPHWWQRVDLIQTVSDGSGPPPFHIRDQEARYAALPSHPVLPADRDALTPVPLATWPATVWLPGPEAATPMESSGPEWQGWEWPSGASVLFILAEDDRLPGLWSLSIVGDGEWQARVAGRPMRVREAEHADPQLGFSAWVEGFVDERTSLFAHANAPSAVERDALLAAVLTIEWMPGAKGEGRRSGG